MKSKNRIPAISILSLAVITLPFLIFSVYQHRRNVNTMRLSNDNILTIFSGEYIQASGLGSATFTLSPDLTFVYVVHTDLLFNMTFTGEANISNDQIQLVTSDEGLDTFVPKYLVPVRWGTFRYLIEPEQIPNFCESIVASEEPLPSGRSFHLHQGWKDLKPTLEIGTPILPNGKSVCG